MPVLTWHRRVPAALACGVLAIGLLGFGPSATASEPNATVSVSSSAGDLILANAQTGFFAGEWPPPENPPPNDPPPGDLPPGDTPPSEPSCDLIEDPDCDGHPGGPGENDPGDPLPELPQFPPNEEPPPSDPPDEAPPPSGGDPRENPGSGTSPDGPGYDDCAAGGLSCANDDAVHDEQNRVIPTSAQQDELPVTGAAGLIVMGLLGAGLVLIGGLLAIRHYRGRHRA